MQADLWQKLGLERNPFPESGPDDVFLQTPAINQRLSLFAQLIRASDLTLLLLGESGIGKAHSCNALAVRSAKNGGWCTGRHAVAARLTKSCT